MRALWLGLAGLVGCSTPPPRQVVIEHVRVGTSEDRRVEIEQGNIASIGASGERSAVGGERSAASGQQPTVIDGTGHTLVPGRFAANPSCGQSPGAALESLARLLAQGVTTAVELGTSPAHGVGLRRFVGTGESRGPRLLAAGPILAAQELDDVARAVSSPDDGRRLVRALADADVDLIAVALSGARCGETPLAPLEHDALCAIVDETHIQDLIVLGLTSDTEGQAAARACGVDALVAVGGFVAPNDAASPPTSESGAAALGLGDALGRIAPGYRADLILLDESAPTIFIDGIQQSTGAPSITARVGAMFSVLWAHLSD